MRYSFTIDGVELVCEYTPPTRPHAIGTVCLAKVLKPQTVALSDVSEPCSAGPNRKRGRKLAYFYILTLQAWRIWNFFKRNRPQQNFTTGLCSLSERQRGKLDAGADVCD